MPATFTMMEYGQGCSWREKKTARPRLKALNPSGLRALSSEFCCLFFKGIPIQAESGSEQVSRLPEVGLSDGWSAMEHASAQVRDPAICFTRASYVVVT